MATFRRTVNIALISTKRLPAIRAQMLDAVSARASATDLDTLYTSPPVALATTLRIDRLLFTARTKGTRRVRIPSLCPRQFSTDLPCTPTLLPVSLGTRRIECAPTFLAAEAKHVVRSPSAAVVSFTLSPKLALTPLTDPHRGRKQSLRTCASHTPGRAKTLRSTARAEIAFRFRLTAWSRTRTTSRRPFGFQIPTVTTILPLVN